MTEWLNGQRHPGQDRDPGQYRHEADPPESPFLKVAPS